ncbi:D-arabitol-phosphate dehydrogenase [Pigmentiphaga humi]|uniref:D-arabitol-phosphate dehydrogenase n=1 Tax=Pigmentiphaga humi TaxID=2478468 RepID=A0A3P4AWJ8_9BURK|nr:alcohol dehydrogenase catalytic domain-containing protein [Pigmentiphaga humi]VCU68417.1 D-arabitol-phosphate dehydrogenase [Pigmentiphaga humi]
MTSMTAARAYATGELKLEKIAVPEPGPGDVLVKVASAGIAPGIAKLLAKGRFRHLPTTLGHEIAGTVAEAGAGVDRALLGQRVRVSPNLTCGHCEFCLTGREPMCESTAMIGHASFGSGPMPLYERYHDGGLADYVRVPATHIDRLPDNVSFDLGAKLHDLGNAVRALSQTGMAPSGRLVITAATGTMGTASIKFARFFGARELVLVARSAQRLEALRPLAGGLPVRTVALEELPDWEENDGLAKRLQALLPNGADAVLDFFPSGPGTAQAMAALATGGALVHMGGNMSMLPFSIRDMMHHCWRFVGTRSCTKADTAMVLELLASGQVQADDLITHHYPLSRLQEAMEATASRKEPIWMAIVHPDGAAA